MKSPGKYFVLLLIAVSLLGAAGTFFNYSRSVFSTNQATVVGHEGRIEARFSPALTAKLHPCQHAKVTVASFPKRPLAAEVITVVKGAVLLQLQEVPKGLFLGESCCVTIDTTIPTDVLP